MLRVPSVPLLSSSSHLPSSNNSSDASIPLYPVAGDSTIITTDIRKLNGQVWYQQSAVRAVNQVNNPYFIICQLSNVVIGYRSCNTTQKGLGSNFSTG